jgi:hypothetical protein
MLKSKDYTAPVGGPLFLQCEAVAEKMMRSTFSQEEKQPGSTHGAQRPRSARSNYPQCATKPVRVSQKNKGYFHNTLKVPVHELEAVDAEVTVTVAVQ